MEKLEGVKPEAEGLIPTTEGGETTQPTEIPTRSEKEFQRAVSKGLESTTRQLDLHKAEADKAKAELKAKKVDIEVLREDIQELERVAKLDEDPTVKEAYISRKAIRDAQRELANREAELEGKCFQHKETEMQFAKKVKAAEVSQKRGIPIEDLKDCLTPEAMEIKGLEFLVAKGKEIEKPPKFDDGRTSGSGKLSLKELVKVDVKKLTYSQRMEHKKLLDEARGVKPKS